MDPDFRQDDESGLISNVIALDVSRRHAVTVPQV
jgi:hypothetical protein